MPETEQPTRQEIEQEIEQHGGPHKYFNNFFSRLPDGQYRDMVEALGALDTTFGQYLKGKSDHPDWHSRIYLNSTPRQLFATIDKLIAKLELGPTLSKLERSKTMNEDKRRQKLDEAIKPIYFI